MSEKLPVTSTTVSYSGLFSVREIFKLVDDWLSQHGWDRIEGKHTEVVTEKGKEIKIELEPEKKESDYVKVTMFIELVLTEVEDVTVKQGKRNIPLNKGKVDIDINAKIVTDYDGKWVKSPIHLMIKAMYDKFIKRSEIDEFAGKLTKDVDHLTEQIKAHLNLFQYKK